MTRANQLLPNETLDLVHQPLPRHHIASRDQDQPATEPPIRLPSIGPIRQSAAWFHESERTESSVHSRPGPNVPYHGLSNRHGELAACCMQLQLHPCPPTHAHPVLNAVCLLQTADTRPVFSNSCSSAVRSVNRDELPPPLVHHHLRYICNPEEQVAQRLGIRNTCSSK